MCKLERKLIIKNMFIHINSHDICKITLLIFMFSHHMVVSNLWTSIHVTTIVEVLSHYHNIHINWKLPISWYVIKKIKKQCHQVHCNGGTDREKSNTRQHLEKLVYVLQHNSHNQKHISTITQTQGMQNWVPKLKSHDLHLVMKTLLFEDKAIACILIANLKLKQMNMLLISCKIITHVLLERQNMVMLWTIENLQRYNLENKIATCY